MNDNDNYGHSMPFFTTKYCNYPVTISQRYETKSWIQTLKYFFLTDFNNVDFC